MFSRCAKRITRLLELPSALRATQLAHELRQMSISACRHRLKRVGVLQTGHASPATSSKHGGYGQLFVNLLKDEGEDWQIFSVVDGQFPSLEDVQQMDGIVITGSRHDAHGTEPWIQKLCHLIQQCHSEKKKILGVCFGHQVLSRALGGKTGPSPSGWTLGLKELTCTPTLRGKYYGRNLPAVIHLLGVHRDEVAEIPPGADLLASTPQTKVEMFAIGDHVLAVQGHPEFTVDIVTDIIDTRLEQRGLISANEASEAIQSMQSTAVDANMWQTLLKTFLKGPPHSPAST